MRRRLEMSSFEKSKQSWKNALVTGVLITLIGLGWGAIAAADTPIGVPNAGFEKAEAAGLPASWQIDGVLVPGNSVKLDAQVRHGGGSSLAVHNATPASIAVMSAPVTMEIGQLYRLKAWVRTEKAFSDPTARYPTAVPACTTMLSFPFTNHSPAVGATRDWTLLETLFIATKKRDRARLHLGFNGTATGKVWFDDVTLEKVEDISAMIPKDTVRWFGPAYRYDDRGWIFAHIEGEPYERGYQYGVLLAEEIQIYIEKLANLENDKDARAGWTSLRFQTDAMMLRKYDPEYQTEMKGIADGAAHGGAKVFGRNPDLVDIATINSVIDLGQMRSALSVTPDATTGINFLKQEDELLVKDELHHCSAMAATGKATDDGRVVFGQIFMWNGYSGIHFDVLLDVKPAKGHRIVYQTFPGGLHSGTDFYISDAGLMIGETTVAQTPYNAEGTPQSGRIRKAIQYANNIEDVVRIMTTGNNGQYTNEWPYADLKNNEVGIFLLGTAKYKLWRSIAGDFPAGLTDFYWCNNNNKDIEVRKEYASSSEGMPYDLTFRPANRDVAFNEFYAKMHGKIDSIAAVNLWASSPTNRPHACDGKITTGDMADKLVFLANYGKLTLREKWVGSRFIRDLPNAIPHLSLGYSAASPLVVTEKLQASHATEKATPSSDPKAGKSDLSAFSSRSKIDKRLLWRGTVYPTSLADNWLISGSAAYWRMLNNLPEKDKDAADTLDDSLTELTTRYLYTTSREGEVAASKIEEKYDRYGHYDTPRVKGTFVLHQLRLLLGNEAFFKGMSTTYEQFSSKPLATAAFISAMEKSTGKTLKPFVDQWINRTGLPQLTPKVSVAEGKNGAWLVSLEVQQTGAPYHLLTHLDITCGDRVVRKPVEIQGATTVLTFEVASKPSKVVLNPGHDVPVKRDRFFTMGNLADDFKSAIIVYGTSRQDDANHTLALRWQEAIGDGFSEVLLPAKKDCEVTSEELATNDLVILGHPQDNSLLASIAGKLPGLEFGRNYFRFRGTIYNRPDDGLMITLPSPYNPKKVIFVYISNSALELFRMTQRWQSLPSWAVFRADKVVTKGFHPVDNLVAELK